MTFTHSLYFELTSFVAAGGASVVAQFDELVIRSCDSKQTITVTVSVTEINGAAIHSYLQHTWYNRSKCNLYCWRFSRTTRPWVLERAVSAASSRQLYRLVQLPQPQESQKSWMNKPDSRTAFRGPSTCKTEAFINQFYSIFFCTEISQGQSEIKILVRTHRQQFTLHLFLLHHSTKTHRRSRRFER